MLGVYHVCLLALATFGRGFVLGSIDSAGVVNLDAYMSHKQFVSHLHKALVNIGLTREVAYVYSAHSMRAERTYSTWRAWPTRTGWPTTTATTWPSGSASPMRLASREEVWCLGFGGCGCAGVAL